MTTIWLVLVVFVLMLLGGVVGLLALRRSRSQEVARPILPSEFVVPEPSGIAEYQPRVMMFETDTPS